MKVYFIGIGGIGVSSLAQYYLAKGAEVSGSDLASSEITALLESKGAKVFIGQKKENISEDLDLVVYSPAVQEDNPEFAQARAYGIKVSSYPQVLGKLSKEYFTIAVSGSHGKSTTVAMVSLILIKAGLNPTVILGTKLKEFGDSNFRLGGKPKNIDNQLSIIDGQVLILEADEYQASFLNYWPNIVVLTNVEEEHLDFFGSFENIFRAFRDYINHLPKDGCLIVNYDDENAKKLSEVIDVKNLDIKPYSLTLPDVEQIRNVLKVPGEHNLSNAFAALTVARAFGVADAISLEALSEYQGAWRRFEIKEVKIQNSHMSGEGKKFKIVSDYAHHPTEIKATLSAAKSKWPDKEIWAVFQPHQYQRTFYFFDRLVKVFNEAKIKKIILVPIYGVAGREKEEIKKKVSSIKLVEAIRDQREESKEDVLYIPSIKEVRLFLEKSLQGGEIVMIMGAGDIYELSKMFST